jgi:hypothetical protein
LLHRVSLSGSSPVVLAHRDSGNKAHSFKGEPPLQQLEQLRLSLQDTFMESVKSILELATSAKSLWNTRSAQDRKEFLNSILSNPILDGVTVRYELKKPFAVLVKMSEKEDWCPGPDLNRHGPLLEPQDFKSCASTNFATGALYN